MTRSLRFVWLSIVLVPGCTRDFDPCPRGTSLLGGQCAVDEGNVRLDAGQGVRISFASASGRHSGAPLFDAGSMPEDAGRDATLEPPPEADANTDAAEDEDTGPDLDSLVPAPNDAADSGDAEADAGDTGAPACAPDDLLRWQDFHLSTQLTTEIGTCWEAAPDCSVDSCPMLQCLMQRAGIAGCADCIAEEAACVAVACAEQCAASIDNETCRACACSHNCVIAFENCGGATMDVCAGCDETTCPIQSRMPPDLLMVVVNKLLL